MSERLFVSLDPNHGDDFPPQPQPGMRTNVPPIINQPSDPLHRAIFDEEIDWNGPKLFNIGPEHINSDWPSPNRHAIALPVTKQAIHIIPSQPRDEIDDLSSISSQERRGESIGSPTTVDLSNPSYGTRAAPTSLLRHDEGWNPSTLSHIIPSHIRRKPMSKDKGGATCVAPSFSTTHHPNDSHQIRRATTSIIQLTTHHLDIPDFIQPYLTRASPCIFDESTSPNHKTKWQNRIAIYICRRTHLTRERKLSRATQQNLLLRRCFYPRRDVIRWEIVVYKRLPWKSLEQCPGTLNKSPALNCGAESA